MELHGPAGRQRAGGAHGPGRTGAGRGVHRAVDPVRRRGLRLDLASSPTTPAAPGPASTSRTSRRRTPSPCSPRRPGQSSATAATRPSRAGPGRRGAGPFPRHPTARRPTSPWSTPGPFHEVRRSAAASTSACSVRRSLAAVPRRATPRSSSSSPPPGLAFFGERFAHAVPAAQVRPGLRARHGRRDGELRLRHLVRRLPLPRPRRRTASESLRAVVLLHEMAHMWFGDIVTMRWWDDLWLNEAFAEWACHWAAAAPRPYADAWATFLAGDKLAGYAADRAPTTHPIRQPVPDVAGSRSRASTGSPTPRARACSSSSSPTSARRRSSRPAGLLRQARLG